MSLFSRMNLMMFLGLVGTILGQNAPDKSTVPFSVAEAKQAQMAYNQAIEEAWKVYLSQVKKAASIYAQVLRSTYKQTLAKEQLDEAIKLRDEIARIAPEFDTQKGLILYFSFDQADPAGKILDQSGLGNHGQAIGSKWTAKGKRGGGYEFGSVSNSIRVPNNDSLNPPHVTMAAWIKSTHKDRFWRRIFDKAWNVGYTMGVSGSDPEGKSSEGQGNAYSGICTRICISKVSVTDGQWHHMVSTFDGAELRLYVDGQLACPPSPWKGTMARNKFDLTIGLDGSTPDEFTAQGTASFTGTMDDVMLFNRALSENEVRLLFQSQQ